jgi:TPR repeat protein
MAEHRGTETEVIGREDAANRLFEVGMRYATGDAVTPDLVAAHKWFNLAAMRGNEEAARLRREIAAEMSQTQIAAAQRAARDWLTTH